MKSLLEHRILERLSDAPKTRKDLLGLGIGTESAVDKALQRLCRSDRIQWQIVDRSPTRPRGMKHYVCQPNPKVRVYSLK